MRIDRERVRRLMLRQGYQTFTELAAAVGVSKQALSLWFNGGNFSSTNLERLCRVLDCAPGDILVMDGDPNATTPVAQEGVEDLPALVGAG